MVSGYRQYSKRGTLSRVPRLNRAASQQRTRRALLRTAREMFVRHGYFATSIDRVAEAAGYSKGAVYSNFAGKDELCLAVLDQVVAEHGRELAASLADAADFESRLAAFETWLDAVTSDRGWIVLEIEFASQLRSNPGLREAFARRAAALRAGVAGLIEAGAAETGRPLTASPDDLAAGVVGMALGLALQRAVDPRVPVRPLVDALRAIAGVPIAALTGPRTDPVRV
jgi:AcrR family transcriptional regulator